MRDHSLFIAFAPVENPEIAISVMIENDFIASTVARNVMDAYFELARLDSLPLQSIGSEMLSKAALNTMKKFPGKTRKPQSGKLARMSNKQNRTL